MEHLVGDNKVSLRGLCGNKAVQRCSAAAYGLKECCTQYDYECGIHPESTKHTHACTTQDVKAMLTIVQQAKPFQWCSRLVGHCYLFSLSLCFLLRFQDTDHLRSRPLLPLQLATRFCWTPSMPSQKIYLESCWASVVLPLHPWWLLTFEVVDVRGCQHHPQEVWEEQLYWFSARTHQKKPVTREEGQARALTTLTNPLSDCGRLLAIV